MRDSVRTHVVCPKCKSMELEFTEVSEAYEKWTQDADGNITDSGEDGALLGGVVRVEATCLNTDCGHKWTVRRAKDITELPNWPKDEDGQPEENEAAAAESEAAAPAAETKEETKAEEPKEEAVAQTGGKKGRPKGSKNKKAA